MDLADNLWRTDTGTPSKCAVRHTQELAMTRKIEQKYHIHVCNLQHTATSHTLPAERIQNYYKPGWPGPSERRDM